MMQHNIYLWLDDIRNPFENPWQGQISSENVVWVKSYDEFINFISNNNFPSTIDFDHDLGFDANGSEKNGYDCAKWLLNFCLDNNISMPSYRIHSSNPVGAQNIESIFNTYEKIYGRN